MFWLALCFSPESDPNFVQRVRLVNIVVHHQHELKQIYFSIVIDINHSHQGKHLLLCRITAIAPENWGQLPGADVAIVVLEYQRSIYHSSISILPTLSNCWKTSLISSMNSWDIPRPDKCWLRSWNSFSMKSSSSKLTPLPWLRALWNVFWHLDKTRVKIPDLLETLRSLIVIWRAGSTKNQESSQCIGLLCDRFG